MQQDEPHWADRYPLRYRKFSTFHWIASADSKR